ncbi:GNAT family N-acetyltransferase [Streptacidiphilus jiangxiensis]|uniref:Ribosomal protein S18 acetylase RimI n=1 Tax=Streptacidiphilus jiangxiensis TaxID=235985 RepID=A0A1H7NP09_STRJI|nr:GNAT family N-acetyltransferase [Streptacidiphilus jiangxiensis]SEL25074.1 Ribosomal protein S18 acetylase RimI [Streptacidiphilus jiangxiensis]
MITIRTASTDDAPLLARLNGIVHELHVAHRPDLFVDSPGQDALEALFRARLGDPSVTAFVADDSDGRSLGYAQARVVSWDASALVQPDRVVSLDQIAVVPEAGGMGVGSALLEAVRDMGRKAGCRRLVTEVWDFNEGARAFYDAAGLQPMNVRLDQPLCP